MGFEISTITNAKLKALAQEIDNDKKKGNHNSLIDNSELSVFTKKAEKKFKKDAGIMRELVSISTFIEAEQAGGEVEAPTFASSTTNLSKSDKKSFLEAAEQFAKQSTTPAEYMSKLEAYAASPEYKEAYNEVKFVYQQMTEFYYDTVASVDKNHKAIKRRLKKNDKWNNFTQDALKQLDKLKKQEIIQGKYEKLEADFNSKVKPGQNDYKAILESIKEELKNNKTWKDNKEAYEQLEKNVKLRSILEKDAVAVAKYNESEYEGSYDTSFKVTKSNKHHQELLDSSAKADKRLDELKSVTYSEMEKELGKNIASKLKNYAIKNGSPANGPYDISGLRTDKNFGADLYKGNENVVNRHDDYKLSERMSIKDGLGILVNDDRDTFTEKETKKLIEFLGLANQEKSHKFKDAISEVFGSKNKEGVIAGVLAGGANFMYQQQVVRINGLTKTLADELVQKTGGQISQNGTGFTVKIKQEQFSNLAGLGQAAAALLVEVALKMLFGMDKDERTCLNVQELYNYRTLEDLETFAKKKEPDKAGALMMLAKAYVEKNKDSMDEEDALQEFYNELNKMKGISSTMNPDECFMTFVAQVTPEENVQNNNNNNGGNEEPETCEAEITGGEKDEFVHTRKAGDTWAGIVEAYYPCLVEDYGLFGKDGAIRRLKKALSYNADGTFNEETYKALLEGKDLPKTMILPKQIEDCTRVDDAQVKSKKIIHGKGKAKIDKVGFGTQNGYVATDSCNGQTATGNTPEEAKRNLEAITGNTYN